jgi:hypothetical protein
MNISRSSLVLGGLLILVGIALLVAQLVGVDLGRVGWPFFVIIPGAVVLILGLWLGGSAGEGLSVVGTMVTTVGLILLYQDRTGHWATWAYAWALVAPTSIGLGQLLFGALHGQAKLVRSGLDTLLAGLGIFIVLGLFFELVIGLSGFSVRGGDVILPAVLIGLGLLLLIRNLFKHRGREQR